MKIVMEVPSGGSGSSVENQTVSSVISGNFSNIKMVYAYGYYSGSASAAINQSGYAVYEPVLGQTYKFFVGQALSSGTLYYAYKEITVYADRIELGAGGYTTNKSTFTPTSGIGVVSQIITG